MKTLCMLWGERGKGWVWHLGLNTNSLSVTRAELFVSIVRSPVLTVPFWTTCVCQ